MTTIRSVVAPNIDAALLVLRIALGVTMLELFGGIAVLVGLLTRLAALGFVADMLGAIPSTR